MKLYTQCKKQQPTNQLKPMNLGSLVQRLLNMGMWLKFMHSMLVETLWAVCSLWQGTHYYYWSSQV